MSICRYFDAVTLGIALLDTTSNCFRDAPSHADALEVLSTVYIQRGLSDDFDAAECHAKEGLAIKVAAHGAKSLEAASMYTVLALAQLRLGRRVPLQSQPSIRGTAGAPKGRLCRVSLASCGQQAI